MLLRNTIESIRQKRIGALSESYFSPHTALSRELSRLQHLEQKLGKPDISRMAVVEEKLAHCLSKQSCESLTRSDWRTVPWLMWKDSRAADHDWFLKTLFNYLAANRPKSVIRALVLAYITFFDPERSSFHQVSQFLLSTGLSNSDRFGEKWLGLHQQYGIFTPSSAPWRIALVAIHASDVTASLNDMGLSQDLLDGGLARTAFSFAYKSVANDLKTVKDPEATVRAIQHLLSWGTGAAEKFRYQNLFAPMATELLEALITSPAPFDIQEHLVRYFISKFGDPRLNRAKWYDVSTAAFERAMHLLIRSTLEDFTRVIDATAEPHHWNQRRPFWLAYNEIGAIDDAWVAFGPNARSRAHNFEKKYARLEGALDKAHSALILRMGDLIIVEWSHNGRCRFFPRREGRWTPNVYADRYDYSHLNHQSNLSGNYLKHVSGWQIQFADKIFRYTGVQHPRFGGR